MLKNSTEPKEMKKARGKNYHLRCEKFELMNCQTLAVAALEQPLGDEPLEAKLLHQSH